MPGPCLICPRECGIDRSRTAGFCGCDDRVRVAKADLHLWEEPCICPPPGSGAVFFSGCGLRCVFCQNFEISQTLCGKIFTEKELTDLFLSLQNDKGAANLNLVTATPWLFAVIPALKEAKAKGLKIPVIFNSSGYEKVETLRALAGLVDVYLPDLKFCDPEPARRFASAPDYYETAIAAIREMRRQTGDPVMENGLLRRGVLIRHLVLPGCSRDSLSILEGIREEFGPNGVVLSLMSQYTPLHRASEFPPLDRRLTALEYQRVLRRAEEIGFECVFIQDKSSASVRFVPDFDWKG